MMVYCSALNCQNATSGVYKNSTVSFYGFPLRNKPLLKQWIHNMGRDIGTPSKYQRLCSNHFEDSSFVIDPFKIRKNRRLLKEAVPKKFILGEDGNWLVGTPQSFCGRMSNKMRKRIRNPEHLRVPGTFDNAAACTGKDVEDWQEEFYKKLIKENHESLTTLSKDCPVPKSSIQYPGALHVKEEREIPASLNTGCGGAVIGSELQTHTWSAENTEPRGSFSGGSLDLNGQISDKRVTSKSHLNSARHQAYRMGNRKGNSFREEEEPDEFKEILLYQQSHARERLYLCMECHKSFKLKNRFWKHQQNHGIKSHVTSYICTECGKNFGRYTDVIRHQKTHTGDKHYKCMLCVKSFLEIARLANHLQTHNIYL
ncbi:zinc finger protein 436-like [Athene cunicularia]|uniref:zinc finger protein 436-like n=1 Tax=Athene cunicularia TaxID=194338 RepID=UPI000EF6BEB6|nr:zinc finger protein 436-like [Athene cunicularia]